MWIKAKIRKAAYVRCRLLISIGHCSEASGDKISGCKKAKQVNSGHLLATVATTINKIIAVKILRLYNPAVLAECARRLFSRRVRFITCGQVVCTKFMHCPKTTPHCGVTPRDHHLSY